MFTAITHVKSRPYAKQGHHALARPPASNTSTTATIAVCTGT